MLENLQALAFDKQDGLLPAIVQDATSGAILMLGYMNKLALEKTLETKQVTFYSRSKARLWMKGETSGHTLQLVDIHTDCDHDALLITAIANGPTCHTGRKSCFGEPPPSNWHFMQELEGIIQERQQSAHANSYTAKLLQAGISRIAQKVGEEGVEVALAAIEKNDDSLCGEIADLLFHVLVLLRARKLQLTDVINVLKQRAQSSQKIADQG